MSASYVIDLRADPHSVKVSDLIIGALAEDVDARLLAPSFLRVHAEELENIARQVFNLREFDNLAKPRNAHEAATVGVIRTKIEDLNQLLHRAAERCRCVTIGSRTPRSIARSAKKTA